MEKHFIIMTSFNSTEEDGESIISIISHIPEKLEYNEREEGEKHLIP